jgi:hypothetical protein
MWAAEPLRDQALDRQADQLLVRVIEQGLGARVGEHDVPGAIDQQHAGLGRFHREPEQPGVLGLSLMLLRRAPQVLEPRPDPIRHDLDERDLALGPQPRGGVGDRQRGDPRALAEQRDADRCADAVRAIAGLVPARRPLVGRGVGDHGGQADALVRHAVRTR